MNISDEAVEASAKVMSEAAGDANSFNPAAGVHHHGEPVNKWRHVARAALAAAAPHLMAPRTITTVEELEALPVESMVRDGLGFTYDKWWDEDGSEYNWWATTGDRREYSSKKIALPATVLHEPRAAGAWE